MALVVKDRVQETTTTTGTGTITLAGAVTGFQSFSVIGNANTTYYTIAAGSQFEVGIGTYTASGTLLSRDTILESSNGGAAVNFSAGIKNVFVTYPAEKSLYLDASNNAIGLGTVATTTTLTNATGLPLTTGVTGTLPIANGGTNLTTYTTGDIVYASATNTLNKLADVAIGNALISGGVGVAPNYGKIGLTTHISGTLPIANGGTGTTSTTFTNLTTNVTGTLPVANGGTGASTLTSANVILGAGTSAVTFVAPGSSGNVLTSNGSTWTSAAAAAGGFSNMTVFTSPGTFTTPATTTKIKVTVVGAGGGSSGLNTNGSGGGGTSIYVGPVSASTPYSVTVGSGSPGATGGTSSFSSLASATGGGPGTGGPTGTAGAGGVGSLGTLNITGGVGQAGSGSTGGGTFLGMASGRQSGQQGVNGQLYGGGAGTQGNPSTNTTGGAGVVVVEF